MLLMFCDNDLKEIENIISELKNSNFLVNEEGTGKFKFELNEEDGFIFLDISLNDDQDDVKGNSEIQLEYKEENQKKKTCVKLEQIERKDKFYQDYRQLLERFLVILLNEQLIDIREMYEDMCL